MSSYSDGFAAGVKHGQQQRLALLLAMARYAQGAGVMLDPPDVLAALEPDEHPERHAELLDLYGIAAHRSLADVPGVLPLAKAPVERDGIVEVELADGETLRIRGTLFAPPF